MGFGGSVAAMVQSIRNNAKQITKRKNYFEKNVSSKYTTSTKVVDYKKLSPIQFQAFREKLKREELHRQKKLATIFGIVMLVIVGLLIYFLFYY